MKFLELIEKDNLVVHCNIKSKAKKLLHEADKIGLRWISGASYIDHSNYKCYKDKTCYNLTDGCYGDISHYKNELKYEIIEFDDIIFE